MEEVRASGSLQMMLDNVVKKFVGPTEFTKDNLLLAVTKFVAVDDQVSLILFGDIRHLWTVGTCSCR